MAVVVRRSRRTREALLAVLAQEGHTRYPVCRGGLDEVIGVVSETVVVLSRRMPANYVLSVVQRVYESFGFVPLETPTIENLSTLLGKYGEEGDQLLYRLLHRRDGLERALTEVRRRGGPGSRAPDPRHKSAIQTPSP